MRTRLISTTVGLAALALASSPSVLAHTIWLEPLAERQHTWEVFFGGHGGETNAFDADRIGQVRALHADGHDVPTELTREGERVFIGIAPGTAMVTLHFDNAIHTRTSHGPSVRAPMTEVEGAVSAVNAQKYHKTILDWESDVILTPVGQAMEVLPTRLQAPRAGEPLRVQVLIDGEPAAGVRIGRGEDTGEGVTDATGVAEFIPEVGFNKLWAGKRMEVDDEPRYTQLSYEYSLVFSVDAP
ncbi:DUF4198 domain-containing protein [Alkalisalibacterium limincola]|uniref:DUF4198 domain-containing protein n=1 Tax=Alkalisalibacterium limincola TaxID=2699169 RepID=A0A5C8L0C3_9GAMM|nr:DUF4198 domain-containing protein [Alkalisalibacterium limincola]TXK65685.1 DUF4198 domain-containing protein [Alkalisalibacterium limincola]